MAEAAALHAAREAAGTAARETGPDGGPPMTVRLVVTKRRSARATAAVARIVPAKTGEDEPLRRDAFKGRGAL